LNVAQLAGTGGIRKVDIVKRSPALEPVIGLARGVELVALGAVLEIVFTSVIGIVGGQLPQEARNKAYGD
jgi:hypothetical protein